MTLFADMHKNALKQYYGGGKEFDAPTRILLAALVEFGKDSPNSVGTREIARRAEINISAISYYFGGKSGLYDTLISQIIEFIRDAEADFKRRMDALKKDPSKEGAKNLLKDYMFWRAGAESQKDEIFKHVESIMMREEFYGGKTLDKIYKNLVEPNDKFVAGLVEMGSGGKMRGDDAKIAAMIITGQTMRFEISKRTLVKTMGWKAFREREAGKVRAVLGGIIDKIFS